MSKTQLRPFIVRFDDWTAYRIEIMAENEDQAIELAQQLCTDDPSQAEAIDGGQEHWEAFPAARAGKAGAP
jgi:hypothetical protein